MDDVVFTFVCLLSCASHAHEQSEALLLTLQGLLSWLDHTAFILSKVVVKQFPPSSSPMHDFEGSNKSILYLVLWFPIKAVLKLSWTQARKLLYCRDGDKAVN